MSETDKKRTIAKSKFTRFSKSLKQSVDEGLSEKTIRSRYEKFQIAWNEVQERHEEHVEHLASDTDFEKQESWIETISTEFFELEGRVDKYLENLEIQKSAADDEKRRGELEVEETRIRDREATKRAEEQKAVEEREAKTRQELFLYREQEGAKFHNFHKVIRNLLDNAMDSADESKFQFISEAIKDAKLKLDDAVSCCDEAQKRYISSLQNQEASSQSEWINAIWELYGTISSEAQIFISRFKADSTTSSKTKDASSSIKLEKIRFRQFAGDIRQYPKFKAEFIKHIQPLCSPNEVAFVLRSHLSDEIYYDIENLGDNMDIIWARLDRKYGDKCKLVDKIMSELKSISVCHDSDNSSILDFIKTIEKADMDLRLMGKEDELHNSTIVGIIEEKLSREIRKEWTKIVTGPNRAEIAENKFPSLLLLLQQFKERIEYDESQIRSPPSQERPQQRPIHHAEIQEAIGQKDPCWMPHRTIPTTHPIWKCRVFQSKSPAERVDLARENNACLACLHTGHSNTNCPRNFRCNQDNCNLPHHSLLHEAHIQGLVLHS